MTTTRGLNRKYEWESIDWTLKNSEIAEKLGGINPNNVSAARKKHAPETLRKKLTDEEKAEQRRNYMRKWTKTPKGRAKTRAASVKHSSKLKECGIMIDKSDVKCLECHQTTEKLLAIAEGFRFLKSRRGGSGYHGICGRCDESST